MAHAPVLCLHPEEAHQIVNAEWYLKQLLPKKSPTRRSTALDTSTIAAAYIKQQSRLKTISVSNKKISATPCCYVHVKQGMSDCIEIQYWFLFSGKSGSTSNIRWLVEGITAYQGKIDLNPIGCQGGHWERICIRFSKNELSPQAIFLPNAEGGEWLDYSAIHKENERPLIYVSKNNHFFYHAKGLKLIEFLKFNVFSSTLEFSMYDECAGDKKINFKKYCSMVQSDLHPSEITNANWLNFEGTWGNPQPNYLNATAVAGILKNAFGNHRGFLLGSSVLQKLSDFLIRYYGKDCHCKAQGPKQKNCWQGPEK